MTFDGKFVVPKSPIFPLPKPVLGQLQTHALPLGIFGNQGVTLQQNICYFTGLAEPNVSYWIKEVENSRTKNLTPPSDCILGQASLFFFIIIHLKKIKMMRY